VYQEEIKSIKRKKITNIIHTSRNKSIEEVMKTMTMMMIIVIVKVRYKMKKEIKRGSENRVKVQVVIRKTKITREIKSMQKLMRPQENRTKIQRKKQFYKKKKAYQRLISWMKN
jgi:hypothetical protein